MEFLVKSRPKLKIFGVVCDDGEYIYESMSIEHGKVFHGRIRRFLPSCRRNKRRQRVTGSSVSIRLIDWIRRDTMQQLAS